LKEEEEEEEEALRKLNIKAVVYWRQGLFISAGLIVGKVMD